MRYLIVLRLLLDVYGATFLSVMLIAVASYGVLPYEALMRLGSVVFYALMAAAFAVWMWLAARTLAQPPEGRRDAKP